MEDDLNFVVNGSILIFLFVKERQPKSFCEWKTTSIYVNGRRPQCYVNGRQPKLFVNRGRPHFFLLMEDGFKFVCKWRTISICLLMTVQF